ncbi:related to pterin-4-alpha-carbinolamine dehydratase [Rhynchosporium graminicola]|uniref:4a-hydroxytetrahydrobiopterin dehydratase n=1 Tax=Rhynchosporium graminicola TaxID=2792576 RepID=A0A1E1L2E8_9HELO|nr:related to pterin-4-alpha-carbinolamine dehydratase [Rhynchosporium commune]
MSSTSNSPTPVFSSTYPADKANEELSPLLKSSGGKWTLIESGKGVERGFKFKTFKKTWEFMNTIASECAVQKHHPEWSNVYNTTFIRWTTHAPPGLSEKDVSMARFCDEKARECGEVINTEESGLGKDLADRVAVEGGDCCMPKGKGNASVELLVNS